MADPDSQIYHSAALQWVDTGTARLPVRRVGSGPALLLVHGFPLSGFTWRKILPGLAERHTCYVPDLPGLGQSEWGPCTDFSFPGQGHTLKILADVLGLSRFRVIAQDTGGTFARYLALEAPGQVERLILINTEIPGHRPPWIPLYQSLMRLPMTPAVFRLLLRSASFLRSPMAFGGCFCDLSLIEGDFHHHFIEPLLHSPLHMEGLRQYLLGAKWRPVDMLARDHARLTMPVHMIWGADDPTFPLERARSMLNQFPNGQLTTIPGARLLVHEERPAEVTRAALAFLS